LPGDRPRDRGSAGVPVEETMKRSLTLTVLALGIALSLPAAAQEQPAAAPEHPDIRLFFQAAAPDRDVQHEAFDQIEAQWRDGYAIMLVDLIRFLPSGKGDDDPVAAVMGNPEADASTGAGDMSNVDPLRGGSAFASRRNPRVQARESLVSFLERQTGQDFGDDLQSWREWSWTQQYDPHPQYGAFLAYIWGQLDPTFRNYFQGPSTIRLDEVQWGGVGADGIPPLDHPTMIPGGDADYLDDSNIVFGFYLDGEARAYPKRILAWHEMLYDKVGDTEMTVVYCTLCGTVIPYKSEISGRLVRFGTSGMLYRSNKLMYDGVTYTLWSSLTGRPVVGRAVGSGMRMEHLPVVTTTWGEWKATHPDTSVLSLDTGFERDYGEGVAYQDYFATDDLMFDVANHDGRLDNKAEVLAVRLPRGGALRDATMAITADFLRANPVFTFRLEGRNLVVVTSAGGANRVYDATGAAIVEKVDETTVADIDGQRWLVTEDALVPADGAAAPLPRVPAFRAFWFGWYAQYPNTGLIGG
jgi:hypothetical protein